MIPQLNFPTGYYFYRYLLGYLINAPSSALHPVTCDTAIMVMDDGLKKYNVYYATSSQYRKKLICIEMPLRKGENAQLHYSFPSFATFLDTNAFLRNKTPTKIIYAQKEREAFIFFASANYVYTRSLKI